ncbi:FimV/HubP family polar landmark protein, partial [Shewanella sp. 125m-7]
QSNETGVATEDDIDDIDALLADFDTSNPEASAEDDLDALLAGFEHNDDQVVQLEQSNETGVATEDDIDDIDALLADFDTSNTNDAQSVNDTEASADDDLDTLLAQLEAEDKSQDDDNELKDIDALSDEMAAELELGFEIAAELELSTTEDTEQQLESDLDRELDALLADLEAPVAELKTEEQSEVQSERAPILEQQAEQELKVEPTPETAQEATAASIQDSNSLDFELSDFEPEVLKSGADSAETEVAGTKVEDMLEFTLPEVDVEPAIDAELTLEQVSETVTSDRESGFFDDLKGNKKPEGNSLDWESIASQSDIAADEELAFSASNERSDDELLTGLTTEGDSQILPFEIEGDEAFSLSDDSKMTVDEALAALDAEELDAKELAGKVPGKSAVAMHDLTTFQKDNGFIDIDMLLSEADEDNGDTDLYKELDVDMGELDSLMGHSPMVDVDDEENSVNAKLDLARAYIEIDDNDSARALLKEVELDGNDRQQTEALGLLKDLV